jgi:hypothetical protein
VYLYLAHRIIEERYKNEIVTQLGQNEASRAQAQTFAYGSNENCCKL